MALPSPAADSTCLVRGVSSGGGADVACSLARSGHGSTLVVCRTERLDALADELRREYRVRSEALVCDLADAEARDGLVRQVDEPWLCASNAFVRAFTAALHADLRGTGATATSRCPGLVKTKLAERADIDGAAFD